MRGGASQDVGVRPRWQCAREDCAERLLNPTACNPEPDHVAAGDAFLCVTGAAKIKVYDRDGKERGESVLGDPYIRDTKNTKGHQSPCTSGHWHPTDRRALPARLRGPFAVKTYFLLTAGALVCLHSKDAAQRCMRCAARR